MKKLLPLAAVLLLSGCATWDKGLDVVDGVFIAGHGTVDILRAAGKDTGALWSNVWSPLGLDNTGLGKPFEAPADRAP